MQSCSDPEQKLPQAADLALGQQGGDAPAFQAPRSAQGAAPGYAAQAGAGQRHPADQGGSQPPRPRGRPGGSSSSSAQRVVVHDDDRPGQPGAAAMDSAGTQREREQQAAAAQAAAAAALPVKQVWNWVQCGCDKWRRLPRTVYSQLNKKLKWFCYMHPNTQFNSCDAPEEDYS